MKRITAFLVFVSLALVAIAQEDARYPVSGQVVDAAGGVPVEGAQVTVLDNATGVELLAGLLSGADGWFSGTVEVGTQTATEDWPLAGPGVWMEAPYPNPVLRGTERVMVPFLTSRTGLPALELYDAMGARIDPGVSLASGVYMYRLRFPDATVSATMRLVHLVGGRLQFVLKPITARSGIFTAASKMTADLDVRFHVEKEGYVPAEEVHTLHSDGQNEFHFQLLPQAAEVTPEARTTSLQNVSAVLVNLTWEDFAADSQTLVNHLSTQSVFEAVGIAPDSTVWARYVDGPLLFIVDGPLPEEGGGDRQVLSNTERPQEKTAGLPVPLRARLLNAFGTAYDNFDPRSTIETILEEKGYLVQQGVATLDVLRGVAGDAVFYMRGHGGAAHVVGGGVTYGLWTASPRDPDIEVSDPVLSQDLRTRRVGMMIARNDRIQDFFGILPTHYAITDAFVDHYMSFGQNSLVYIDACGSAGAAGGASANNLMTAFGRKNAAVYAGWTNFSGVGAASKTARYVFDRLTGANLYQAESPPQRPFDYASLPKDPKFGKKNSPYGYSFAQGYRANLRFLRLGGDFDLLAPSISHLEVDEINQVLKINGMFGPEPSPLNREIRIGGQMANVVNWTDPMIEVQLPPDLAGDVVVEVFEHKSNTVPLTEWRGEFKYIVDASPLGGLPPETLTQEIVCTLHLRADIHAYRVEPGGAPIRPPVVVLPAQDSSCTWAFKGSGTNGAGQTFTMAGSGALPWTDVWNNDLLSFFYFYGEIDPDALQLEMRFYGQILIGQGTVTISDENASVTTPLLFTFNPAIIEQRTTIHMDAGYGLMAGSRVEASDGFFPVKQSWEAISATYPPNADTAAKQTMQRSVSPVSER